MTLTESMPDVRSTVEAALGMSSPKAMLVAWFLIGAFVIVTSSIGLVGTLLLLPLVILGLVVAILRLVPAIEERWPL